MLKRILGKMTLAYVVLMTIFLSMVMLGGKNTPQVFAISSKDCRLASENGQTSGRENDVSDAVKWACSKISDGSTSRWGVVWFNSEEGNADNKQDYIIHANLTDAEASNDETDLVFNAYLHGQFYSGSNGGRERDGMNAWAIRFVEPERYKNGDEEQAIDVFYHVNSNGDCTRYEGEKDTSYCHPTDTVGFIDDIGTDTVLVRGASSSSDAKCSDSDSAKKCITNNTWSKSGRPLTLKINWDNMIREGVNSGMCSYNADTDTVTCTVGMYRCPHTSITSTGHANPSFTCGTDNGKMIIDNAGRTLGRVKIKVGKIGSGHDVFDAAAVTYDGSYYNYGLTDIEGVAGEAYESKTSVSMLTNVTTANYKVKLKPGERIKFNFHALLKRTVPEVLGEYAICYPYASNGEARSCRNIALTPQGTSKQVDAIKVYANVDQSGAVSFKYVNDAEDSTEPLTSVNNKFCYALLYKGSDSVRQVNQGRIACAEVEVEESDKPVVQGRIVMEAAADPTSNGSSNTSTAQEAAKITIASPMTNWENGSHVTKEISTTVNGSSADVYAQWRFDAKLNKIGKYKAKIIGCRSIGNDVCENWIKDVTISDYRGISSGSKINGSDGTKIITKKSVDANENQSPVLAHAFHKIEDDKAHEYSDALPKNGSYTVCYKSFVAEYSAPDDTDDAENPVWNTSYACAKFKDQQDGKVQGKTTLKYNKTNNGSCSVQSDNSGSTNASSSTSGSVLTVERSLSADKKNEPTFISLLCPEGTDKVNVNFSHSIWSDELQNKAHFYAKNLLGEGDISGFNYSAMKNFYDKKLPSTTPGTIATTNIKSQKKNDGTYTYTTNDSNGGSYELASGNYICESLQGPDSMNTIVCVGMKTSERNEYGPINGYSLVDIVSSNGCRVASSSISQDLKSQGDSGYRSYPYITIECENSVTAKFSHRLETPAAPIVARIRHRIYNNPHPGSGGVNAAVDHYHEANTKPNETLFTNSNGQYVINPGDAICESQQLGTGEHSRYSGVCVKVVPTTGISSGCPNAITLSPTKESGDSYLVTTIKNINTGATSSVNTYSSTATSTDTLLAKPTDQITFNHCYYNGAQAVRTTEYWDQIKEEKPSNPTSVRASACKMVYKQDETAPTHCDTAPTYYLSPKSTACTNGDWTNCDGASGSSYNGYTVEASKLETLKEANYVKGSKTTNNSLYNSYSVSTVYPNVNYSLGNGVYDGSASSISDNEISSGYISMDYGGDGFSSNYNGGTGTEGEVGTGIAENARNTFVTVGAPGGYLTQSVTAYVGKVVRKQHSQTWEWPISYYFTKCVQRKIPNTDPAEYKPESECVPSIGTVSYSSAYHGNGSGNHGSAYYERNEGDTTYANKTISASVYVPYNYTSSALVELAGDKIYSGERFTLQNSFVYINPKVHSSLGGRSYATIAPGINVELYAYISDTDQTGRSETRTSGSLNGCAHYLNGTSQECATIDSTTRTFNVLGKMDGTQNDYRESPFAKTSYNAFDYVAGRYLCVGLGLNRSETTSYSYATNGSELNNNSIYYSSPSCKKIYKKPTFAVWGGSVFSNGNVDVNKMEKRNVKNYNNYQSQGTVYMVTFSPWVEGVVVGNNTVKNLASGAATGYTFAGTSGTFAPVAAPGGFAGNDYCNMSAITIANENCASGTAGDLNQGNRTGVKTELIRRYIEPFFDFDTNTQKTGSDCSSNGRNLCFTPGNGTFSADGKIQRTDVEYGTTYIYASKNDITINADITYKEQYVSPSHISQVIIYSKGDINIIGDVNRVDAILIAEGKVNTCSTNSETCHKQLRINGSIIADKIEFKRLYGASVGSYSVEPAEIVNFSPTIFLWSSVEASSEINENITETYTRELAPRQ